MAIVHLDGFDHYPTGSHADTGLDEVEGYLRAGDIQIHPSDRFGNQGKMLACDSGNLQITNSSWWGTYDRLKVGFAIKWDINWAEIDSRDFFRIYNSNGSEQITLLRRGDSGLVNLYRGSTLIQQSTNALNKDTWYWIEISAFINGSNGTCEMRVDGSSSGWIDYGSGGGGNTLGASATTNVASINLVGDSSRVTDEYVWFDDLVIQDDDASNPWIGDSRITTLYPRTDTVNIDLATYPNSGDDNAQFLNDEGLDGPSEDDYYVFSSTLGDEDYYNFDTIDNTDDIHAIALHYRARKTNTAQRRAQSLVSANSQTGTARELSINYINYYDTFQYQDPTPASEVNWDKTNLDASTFGVKVET
jgi:hypothetical protein